jgi:phosphotriesterase-related protein
VDVHEHVILNGADNPLIPEDFHHIETEKIATELQSWKDAGGGAIVDSSPISVGRNIELLAEVSRAVCLPIIAASGFHKASYYPETHWIHTESEESIHEILLGECIQGILLDDHMPFTSNRSQVRAGILKFGVDALGITPLLGKIISAMGKTMETVDVNCMVHTEPGVPFVEVLRKLDENHIPPNRTIFCHMGKSLESEHHRLLAGEGYYLEFDEMVRPSPPLPDLARAILHLFEGGFGQKILFAGDLARRSYWRCYGGRPGLDYLLEGLDQDLMKLGFTREMLATIWNKNPQRFFSGT